MRFCTRITHFQLDADRKTIIGGKIADVSLVDDDHGSGIMLGDDDCLELHAERMIGNAVKLQSPDLPA